MNAIPYAIGSDHWPGVSKLIEELGELEQVLGKLIATGGETAHWDGSDLRRRFVEEIGDVLAACRFFAHENLDPEENIAISSRQRQKERTFRQWHAEQSGGQSQ